MKKEDLIFVEHIIESVGAIEQFTSGITKSDFLRCLKTQDAVVRRLEIIGEATKNISTSFQKKYSDIPWQKMARMRDRLIHHYFGVDLKVVWSVVKKELPSLKKRILHILSREKTLKRHSG